MSTVHHTWPRQLRLPGQVAAPDGPIDMRMMYVMHHAFRRDLDLFSAAVRNTPAAERDTWARLGTAEEVATLTAMEAEHGEIDPLLEGCGAGFRRLADQSGRHADEDARAALAVRVCAARESLRRHLAHEETEAIAIIQRLLSAEDWSRIEEEHAPPVRLAKAVRLVPWAAYGVPREALDRVFNEPGGRGFRLIWRLTRRRFSRRHARTFRFA